MKKSILKSTALVLCAGLVCCLLLTAAIFDAKTTQQTETQLRSLSTALSSAYDAHSDADAQAALLPRRIYDFMRPEAPGIQSGNKGGTAIISSLPMERSSVGRAFLSPRPI